MWRKEVGRDYLDRKFGQLPTHRSRRILNLVENRELENKQAGDIYARSHAEVVVTQSIYIQRIRNFNKRQGENRKKMSPLNRINRLLNQD